VERIWKGIGPCNDFGVVECSASVQLLLERALCPDIFQLIHSLSSLRRGIFVKLSKLTTIFLTTKDSLIRKRFLASKDVLAAGIRTLFSYRDDSG
jgi:hypothetical protein